MDTTTGRAAATEALTADMNLPGAEAVSASVAAAMLGVSRGRVYQLVGSGKVERHPDGGVTATSVAQRLRWS